MARRQTHHTYPLQSAYLKIMIITALLALFFAGIAAAMGEYTLAAVACVITAIASLIYIYATKRGKK